MSALISDFRPFSSGSEAYDWLDANCERCTKNGEYDPKTGNGPWPMETAVSRGFILGTVPSALAMKYGATVDHEDGEMPRQCSQFSPRMVCESIYQIMGRRKCGEPATETVVDTDGLTRAVCAAHGKAYREDSDD